MMILLVIVSVLFLVAAIILFAPFRLMVLIDSRAGDDHKNCARLWWLHPWLINGEYHLSDNRFIVSVLGKQRYPAKPLSEANDNDSPVVNASPVQSNSAPDQPVYPSKTNLTVDKKLPPPSDSVKFSSPPPPSSTRSSFDQSTDQVTDAVSKKSLWGRLKQLKDRYEELKLRLQKSVPLYFLRHKRFRTLIWHWFWRIIKSLRMMVAIERFHCTVAASLSDYALTGMVYGYTNALSNMLRRGQPSKVQIHYEPVFDGGESWAIVDVRISTSIARLLFPLAVALFTFPYGTGGYVWYKALKNRKEFNKKAPSVERGLNTGTP